MRIRLRFATTTMTFMTLMFAVSFTAPTQPAEAATRIEECVKAKQKIRWLQSRMRQGYTARQGVRWKAELRRLRKVRAQSCR